MTAQNHHQLVFPDDSRYDDARQAWNLAADLRPAVVALPTSVEDVVNAVQYAGERDLRIVVQGTGHGAGVHAPLDGAMLVNMREMRARRDRRRRQAGAARGRRALGRRRHPGHRAGADRSPRLVPERRRRRLLARRRHRLAGTHARPLGRERARRRARHCRRCADPGRSHTEHRSLLGVAGRRRWPRRRGRARDRALRGR